MELSEQLLYKVALCYRLPLNVAIDQVPDPRREIAGRYRQQLGRFEVLVERHVSGERLCQPNEVER